MLVSLERVKGYLRVDPDYSRDDDEIRSRCEAAEELVAAHIDRPIYADADAVPPEGTSGYDVHAIVVTTAIANAILMLTSALYYQTFDAGRDGAGTLPDKVAAMLGHLRVWRSEVEDG